MFLGMCMNENEVIQQTSSNKKSFILIRTYFFDIVSEYNLPDPIASDLQRFKSLTGYQYN